MKGVIKFIIAIIISLIFVTLFEYMKLPEFLVGWFGCAAFMVTSYIYDDIQKINQ